MRKFDIWVENDTETLEMPDTATDAECEAACRDILEVMLGNIDSGFNEIKEDGT